MEAGDSSPLQRSCNRCSKPCSTHCGKCAKAFYCSRECQQQDRKAHKAECFPVEVLTCSQTKWRRLLVTKPISAGEVIWKEKPLVFGPFNTTRYNTLYTGRDRSRFCTVCCAQMNPGERILACPWCTCAMCSKECCNDAEHLTIECPAISRLKQIGYSEWSVRDDMIPSEFIILLRMMSLRNRNPGAYESLLKLNKNPNRADLTRLAPSHSELTTALVAWFCDNVHIAFADSTVVEQKCLMKLARMLDALQKSRSIHGYSAAEVNDLLEILQFNAYDDMDKSFVRWISPYGSSARHSCLPNVDWRVDSNKVVHFRALRDLAVGEEITVSKVGSDFFKATPHRRLLLRIYYNILCDCARCADPTELGSYAAAQRCPKKCPNGWLLLESPTLKGSGWKCTECHQGVPQEVAAEITKEVETGSGLRDKTEVILDEHSACPTDVFVRLHQLLQEVEGRVLHSNHQDLIILKELLIRKMENLFLPPIFLKEALSHGGIPVIALARILFTLAQQLLDSRNPGIGPFSTKRGEILAHQYGAVAYMLKHGRKSELAEMALTRERADGIRAEAKAILNFAPLPKHLNLMSWMLSIDHRTNTK